jgi:hypothetical protein
MDARWPRWFRFDHRWVANILWNCFSNSRNRGGNNGFAWADSVDQLRVKRRALHQPAEQLSHTGLHKEMAWRFLTSMSILINQDDGLSLPRLMAMVTPE